ncbi:MAG: CsbD family protein [Xenococcaceae cyanobacterium]
MSTENRVEATIKNIEGKAQEIVGEITGNPKDKQEGKLKQGQAQLEHSVENLKDEVKNEIDRV